MNKDEMLQLRNWAIIGVTPKKDRYGYKIWRQMKEKGYTVYGVNPNYEEIDGEKIFASLQNISEPIDAIDIIIGPSHVPPILEAAREKGIRNLFFQPGSYDREIIEMAEEMGFNYIEGDCVYASLLRKDYQICD
ncbi:MAG: CoA-binding protein [Tissierellia bacterium]|jgi:predicted CoA-binding protein|nr:CoA-binding protein [Bacillota bacterium]NLK58793.1 CoA-binding protein [Tissierellia bacterium]